MITLEQIQLLEQRVESILRKFTALQEENSSLQKQNVNLQAEAELLREQLVRFEENESKIEQGIVSVLNQLNTVEDTLRKTDAGESLEPPSIDQIDTKTDEFIAESAEKTDILKTDNTQSAQFDIF